MFQWSNRLALLASLLTLLLLSLPLAAWSAPPVVAAVIAETSTDYPTIQGAINAATAGQNVVVQPGIWHERIDFMGKAVVVRSTDPNDPATVEATIIDGDAGGSVVTFATGEASASKLWGLTIQNGSSPGGYGGGVYCYVTDPTVIGNIIKGNSAYYGGGVYTGGFPARIFNNLIVGNTAICGGGIFSVGGAALVTGNTIVGNTATTEAGGYECQAATDTFTNNIVIGNNPNGVLVTAGATPTIRYCDVYNNTGGNYSGLTDPTGSNGNLSADPLFGDATAYRLQSRAGRWDGAAWVQDAADSPCLDKGNPASPFVNEPYFNGGCVNMGYEGNTTHASKSFLVAIIAETSAEYSSVQAAISAATTGQNVVVQPGTWHERIDFKGKGITVRSTNPSDPAVVAGTVLDGDGAGSVVTFANSETNAAVLQGLTITNGTANPGGGVSCNQTSPTITGNVVTGNYAGNKGGAGISCSGGSPTISGNTISGNKVLGGGSIDAAGGGISCKNSSPTISQNLITGNTSSNEAGGIRCVGGGTYTITGNVITHNSATNGGGGLGLSYGDVAVVGNTIVANTSGYMGGGIYMWTVTGALSNLLVVGNTAPATKGGGIASGASPNPSISYCDVWGNTGGSYAGLTDPTGSDGNISADPLFADAANDDYRLKSKIGRWNGSAWVTDAVHSPGIDAGDPAAAFANEPDFSGGRVNMGYDGNTAYASKSIFAAQIAETGVKYATVQGAMDAATTGQNVVVQPGTWFERIDYKGKNIVVRSTDPTSAAVVTGTVLDGSSGGSVVTFINGETNNAKLWGLTITHGTGQTAPYHLSAIGGGIFCNNGSSPTIMGNLIVSNSAHDGGGLATFYGASAVRVIGNTFRSNSAGSAGGAIYAYEGTPLVSDNLLQSNTAFGGGGGIYAVGNTGANITGNILSSNSATAGTGGGISAVDGTVTINGNTFCDNGANQMSTGAIWVQGSGVFTIRNSIFAYNSGGISSDATAPSITYCDVWGSTDTDYSGLASPGAGCISTDPLWVDPNNGDFRLQSEYGRWSGSAWVMDQATSPCLDAGRPGDLYGNEPTPNGNRVNLGYDGNTAYASKSAGPTGLIVLSATYVDGNHVDVLFSEALQQASAETVSNYGLPYLGVTGAALQGDNVTVRLATGDQDPGRTYTVFVHGVRNAGGTVMGGTGTTQWTAPSAANAPSLVSATYVNQTQVDVLFTEALQQASAETAANYRIPYLTVTGAALQPDTKTVRLTTSLQPPDRTFTVFVSNVKNAAGLHMVGTQTRQWTTPSATLTVDSATYVDGTHVDLLFSTALEQTSAETIANYSIPYLTVSGAALQADNETVRLTTTPQPPDRTLKVFVRGVYSAAGAGMAGSQTAEWTTPPGTLTLVSATYVDTTHVDVLFGDALDQGSAETTANFSIPYLTVSAAVLQADTKTVRLTTTNQPPNRTFTVFVRGVYSAAGVAMAGTKKTSWNTPGPHITSVLMLSGVSAQATPAGVAVTYSLSAPGDVEVTVTNLAGRVVARIAGGVQAGGAHTALWSGRCLTGTRAPAGRYLFQVTAADASGNRTTALVPAAR